MRVRWVKKSPTEPIKAYVEDTNFIKRIFFKPFVFDFGNMKTDSNDMMRISEHLISIVNSDSLENGSMISNDVKIEDGYIAIDILYHARKEGRTLRRFTFTHGEKIILGDPKERRGIKNV